MGICFGFVLWYNNTIELAVNFSMISCFHAVIKGFRTSTAPENLYMNWVGGKEVFFGSIYFYSHLAISFFSLLR